MTRRRRKRPAERISPLAESKRIWPALLIICLLFGAPHIYFIIAHGYAAYDPIPFRNANSLTVDEHYYSMQLREFEDGHPLMKNAQLAEHKEGLDKLDVLPLMAIGLLEILPGIGPKEIIILTDFIFAPLLFFLMYLLFLRFRIPRSAALMLASFLIVFDNPLVPIYAILTAKIQWLTGFNAGIRPLEASRFFTPLITATIFYTAILSLHSAIKTTKTKYYVVTAALGAALMYSSFHFFVYFWALLGSITLIYLFLRDWRTARRLILAGCAGIALGLPYLINLVQLRLVPYANDIALRLGTDITHRVDSSSLVLLPLIALVLLTKARREDKIFLVGVLCAGILSLNTQVITGVAVQIDHFWVRILYIMTFFIAMYLAVSLRDGLFMRSKEILKSGIGKAMQKTIMAVLSPAAMLSLAALIIIFGFYVQLGFAHYASDTFVNDPEDTGLYAFLNSHTPEDSVVMSVSIEQNSNLAVHTHNNVYLANAFFTSVSTEEIMERICGAYASYGIPDEVLVHKLNINEDTKKNYYWDFVQKKQPVDVETFEDYMFLSYYFHHQYFDKAIPLTADEIAAGGYKKGSGSEFRKGYKMPEDAQQHLLEMCAEKDYPFFRVDYILVGPYERSIMTLTFADEDIVFSNEKYSLYTA
ncbi:MAG: hypothetical protein ABIH41_00925 [Nanoarchaeota archaeon]